MAIRTPSLLHWHQNRQFISFDHTQGLPNHAEVILNYPNPDYAAKVIGGTAQTAGTFASANLTTYGAYTDDLHGYKKVFVKFVALKGVTVMDGNALAETMARVVIVRPKHDGITGDWNTNPNDFQNQRDFRVKRKIVIMGNKPTPTRS